MTKKEFGVYACLDVAVYDMLIYMIKKFAKLREFWQLNKQKIILGFFIIAIAVLSYGLGYARAKEEQRAPIIIEKYSED